MLRGPGCGSRRRAFTALLPACALAAGCAGAAPPRPTARIEAAPLVISPEAKVQADTLLETARRVEPDLTALLVAGAERLDVLLYGLEYRLKSRASLERKIQTLMLERGRAADEVVINDTVRYTVILDDQPPGDYNDTVADILRRADERGFPVLEVKNYWPEGDTYSGLNCVLQTPEGLTWELQFHTIGSLAAKNEGHKLYDEFRLPGTPLKRKREIFDRLAERWSWVQVPDGILVANSVHVREEIILHSRP